MLYPTVVDYFTIYDSPLTDTEKRQFIDRFPYKNDILFDTLCDESNEELGDLCKWCPNEKKRLAYYIWGHAVFLIHYHQHASSSKRRNDLVMTYDKAVRFERDYDLRIHIPKQMFLEILSDDDLPLYDRMDLYTRFLGPTLIAVGI